MLENVRARTDVVVDLNRFDDEPLDVKSSLDDLNLMMTNFYLDLHI